MGSALKRPAAAGTRPSMRRLWVAAGACALAGLFSGGLATSIAAADSTCSGNACFWQGVNYTGDKVSKDASECCDWHIFNEYRYSAKNRLSNRMVKYRTWNAGIGYLEYCMDPGENRPYPGEIRQWRIGGIGSRC